MKSDFCLVSPVSLGAYTLPNRLVIAPHSRSQADNHLLQSEAVSYYSNRASCGLIVTEPTLVAPQKKLPHYPGIYTRQQLNSWSNVTEKIRKQNGKIFLQLWYDKAIGQCTQQLELISMFRDAAKNALAADFDGVEVNLNLNLNQLQTESNIELLLSITKEVTAIWDENKVGIRLALSFIASTAEDTNFSRNFCYLLDALEFQRIAYVHLINLTTKKLLQNTDDWLDLLHLIYSGRIIIGYENSQEKIKDVIMQHSCDLVSFNTLAKLLI